MGPVGWILAICAGNGAVLAALVASNPANRAANRFLALLLALISLRLLIYVLGFAGAFDAAPWLTFLPLDASLAFGALLWLYVDALTQGRAAARWLVHLLPAAAQIAYQAAAFALPLPAKWAWYTGPHLHVVEPVVLLFVLLSSAVYVGFAWRRHQRYQHWLDANFADREAWRLTWLRLMIAAFALALLLAAMLALWSAWVESLDYFQRTPVMFGFSLLVYVMGLLGWRHGAVAYPRPVAEAEPANQERRADYVDLCARWRHRVDTAEWWREEQVTLAEIARRLGVSERTLSRGLRDGGQTNFNEFINTMRVAAVQRLISAGADGDLLGLALECGFNSKASFNRAFKASTGQTPSGWRSAAQLSPIAEPIVI